jgi:hypothetical protein
LVESQSLEDHELGIEHLDVKDSILAPIPDLVVLEETGGLLFSYPDVKQILGLYIGIRNEVLIAEERDEAENQRDDEEGKGDPVKTDSSCLHGGEFGVSRQVSESEEGRQQDTVRHRPLEGDQRNLIQEVFKNEVKGGLILGKDIHFLEEEHHKIDEDETTQAEAEESQEFNKDVPLKDP